MEHPKLPWKGPSTRRHSATLAQSRGSQNGIYGVPLAVNENVEK